MSELTPQTVLRKAHERMTRENWEPEGWGDGNTACLMHQLALVLGERPRYSLFASGPLGKSTSYLRRAIKNLNPEWYEKWGKHRDRRTVIMNFNDDERTSYEDASMVLKEAWYLSEQEGL